MIRAKDHDELLYKIQKELKISKEYNPRGQKTLEIINANLVLTDPYKRLVTNKKRKFSNKYVAAEISWYLSGERNIEKIRKYAKMWDKIKDEKNEVNSAYGYQIFKMKLKHYNGSQYDWVINTLKKDKYSRQALININLPSHKGQNNKDFVCTLGTMLYIRDNKLDMINTMRSNDSIYGLGNDLPFFTFLQEMFLVDLKNTYKELKMGNYYHNAGSLHVYEKHYNMMDNIIHEYEKNASESTEMPRIDDIFLEEFKNNKLNTPKSKVGKWLLENMV